MGKKEKVVEQTTNEQKVVEQTTNEQNVEETKTEEILDLGVEIPEDEIIDEEV